MRGNLNVVTLEEVAGRLVGPEHRVEGALDFGAGAQRVDDEPDEVLRARGEAGGAFD